MSRKICRILSIDGGGIRGVLPAVWLGEIERKIRSLYNRSIPEYFDYIAGTSTGSIIALALALGKSPEQILSLYESRAREIFPYSSKFSFRRFKLLFKSGLSAPKYNGDGLRKTLLSELGETPIGAITSTNILVPFYDTEGRSTQFIKNYLDVYAQYRIEHLKQDPTKFPKFKTVPAWEAAVCSASAPTFFPAHHLATSSKRYSAIDGGVSVNNPTACVMADAIGAGYHPQDIHILSLGTGNGAKVIPYKKAREWGTVEWAVPIIEVLMNSAVDTQRHIAQNIVGNHHFCSFQIDLVANAHGQDKLSKDMDDASKENIQALKSVAETYYSAIGSKLLDTYFEGQKG